MIRVCCDPVPPIITRIFPKGVMIYCPICGSTVRSDTREEAVKIWNDYRDSMDLDAY